MSLRHPLSERWVFGALLAFAVGFALFWPRVFLVVDEDRYVSQAVAFASGQTTVDGAEILFPPTRVPLISDYPPGTSLLQTPLVWIGGWRAASLLSAVALIVMTLVAMRWLKDNSMHPAFALLIPGFLGASFFARIGMSDVPSGALVAVTLYLLWRAERTGWATSLFAGLCAGISLLFREPVLVLLAPFVAGALLRRRGVTWALATGVVAGVAIRLGLSALLFDSALYLRDSGYGFSPRSLAHALPVYAIVLMVMFPGGALLPFFYRGPRRAEVVTSVSTYVLLFLLYEYDPVRQNGTAKGLILASRFMIPLLPPLTLMAADVWPRWVGHLRERAPYAVHGLARLGAVGAIAVAFLVHPLAHRQEAVPLAIVHGIYSHTSDAVPIITNTNATLKYLSPSYGPRKLILRHDVNADSVASFARRFGRLGVVLLDRSDSEMFRDDVRGNAGFLAALQGRCTLRLSHEEEFGGWAHLRIFDVSACA